jgi:metal-responsive CopG/Arc/MetJ family transcriptional regulator
LIPETMLEELQDFDVWKEWKSNSDFFQQLIRKHIDMMD